jgi:hypothetical protein
MFVLKDQMRLSHEMFCVDHRSHCRMATILDVVKISGA